MSLLSTMIPKRVISAGGVRNFSFCLSNKIIQYFGLFFLISSPMGCHWPVPATGGYADRYPLKIRYSSCSPNDPFHHTLKLYYHLTEQLRILQNSQVGLCYPARLAEMNLLSQQIVQETAAGLILSAQIDNQLLENNIAAVWNYRYVKGCPKLKSSPHWLILQSRIQ